MGRVEFAAVLYLGLALFDLSGQWKQTRQRRTFWVVLGLHLAGAAFALAVATGYEPYSPFRLIRAIYQPLGAAFLKPLSGGS